MTFPMLNKNEIAILAGLCALEPTNASLSLSRMRYLLGLSDLDAQDAVNFLVGRGLVDNKEGRQPAIYQATRDGRFMWAAMEACK